VDVPGFVSLIAEKRYGEALQHHRERNPFASVCARVCFHPCENKCRRSTLDESVSIRGLKRFMVEEEKTIQLPEIRANAQNAKRKVAIIGAGPAGLSCAYFLARLGYKPTVFEAEPKPGGMLLQAIPAYRLPRKELMREIHMIERVGADIRCNKRLGKDITLQGLRDKGYEAVFLAVGAPQGARLGIPGDDAEGVTESLRFLKEYNVNGAAGVGKDVVVIGGGNAAVDAARTALRLGAGSVRILYRRTRAEMPAYAEEVAEAEREGAQLEVLVAPVEIVVQGGRAAGVKCQRMSLGEFDKSGRRRPVPVAGSEFVVNADQVIAAIGQTLNPAELFGGLDVKLNKNNLPEANPVNAQTSVAWLFAGGDAITGPASVVEAIGWGERAAVSMDAHLTGENHAFWRTEKDVGTFFDPEADPAMYVRAKARLIPLEQRKRCFAEVELAWSEAVAGREAKRCLRCDYRDKESK
jgi:NADH-quinone oxidoreductase subunit F